MKLASASIRNFRGIEELDINPGAVTIFSGDNATGKTSALSALASIFEGGHQPADIRNGTRKSEIEIELLDDKGELFTVRKSITPKSSTVTVSREDGSAVPSPQSWLKSIASGIGFDPVQFVIDKKARAQFIQEALPTTFTPAEAQGATFSRS